MSKVDAFLCWAMGSCSRAGKPMHNQGRLGEQRARATPVDALKEAVHQWPARNCEYRVAKDVIRQVCRETHYDHQYEHKHCQ